MLKMPSNPRAITYGEKLVVYLIFAHYLVFELVFFFSYDFLGSLVPVMTIWKTAFPVCLLAYAVNSSRNPFHRRESLALYTVLFALLLALTAVASFFNTDTVSSMYEWFKLAPRLIFFIATVAFFATRPAAIVLFTKAIVAWSSFSVLQYSLLVVTGGYRYTTVFSGMPAIFAGPLGVLGNITSTMNFPGIPFPILRLCGFWNEPSNACGTLFAGFFLGHFLYGAGEAKFWKTFGNISLVGGVATLSNAGYAAIACALAFGAFFQKAEGWAIIGRVAALIAAVILVFLGFFGRTFVAQSMPDNEFAKALVGVRVDFENVSIDEYDPFSGRLDLIAMAVENVKSHPFGIGVVTSGNSIDSLSASAPVVWFTYAGFFGLLVLVMREGVLAVHAAKTSRRSVLALRLSQAWIVVLVQQASYGIWMNPLYMILSALVLLGVPRPTSAFTARGKFLVGRSPRRVPTPA